MIDLFHVPMWEEHETKTEQDITTFLKYAFNKTEKIHKPYSTHPAALSPKEKYLEYTELLCQINQNWELWLANAPKPQQKPPLAKENQQEPQPADCPSPQQEQKPETPKQPQILKPAGTNQPQIPEPADTGLLQASGGISKKLYDTVVANLYLRIGQCEEQLFLDSSESYKKALKLLREYHPLQDGHASGTLDGLLSLLIQLNLGKYLRNMSYFESRSRFNLAIHAFEKTIQTLETQETGKFSREQTQIWLEAAINIGKAKKNLYDLAWAEEHFKTMARGLGNLASKEKQNLLKETKLCQSYTKEQGHNSYQRLWADKKTIDIFLVRALVQLAVIYRKQRNYDEATYVCKAVIRMEPENADAINNLGVCHRKNGNYEQAIGLFKPLMRRGNRLAKINYWKCVLRQEEGERGRHQKRNPGIFKTERTGPGIPPAPSTFPAILKETQKSLCHFSGPI